jgi:hypothetical protein
MNIQAANAAMFEAANDINKCWIFLLAMLCLSIAEIVLPCAILCGCCNGCCVKLAEVFCFCFVEPDGGDDVVYKEGPSRVDTYAEKYLVQYDEPTVIDETPYEKKKRRDSDSDNNSSDQDFDGMTYEAIPSNKTPGPRDYKAQFM